MVRVSLSSWNNGLSLIGKILDPVVLMRTVVLIISLILVAMSMRIVLTLVSVIVALIVETLVLVLITVLDIIVLIEAGWSKEIVRTIAEKITVPLWLVTITSLIVGTLSSIYVLLSVANGGWTLGI